MNNSNYFRDEIWESAKTSVDPVDNPEEEKDEIMEVITPEAPQAPEPKQERKWRAKLYQLNSDGGWDDLGTGYSHIDTKK